MYKYKKISNKIKSNIKCNNLKKLPSVRQLMKEHRVSQSTIIKAIEILKSENIIYTKKNNGYHVVYRKKSTNNNEYFDFSTTSSSWSDFPLEDYAKCLGQVMSQNEVKLFQYGDEKGEKNLRDLLKKILFNDFIYTDTEKLIVTSGSQQALHILSLIIIQEEGKLLIEQPTYHHMINLIEIMGVDYVRYHHNLSDFDIERFEEIVIKYSPKFVYLMPRLHNPLGISLSENQKVKIVELSERYDFYIIEDDYMGDFINDNNYHTMYELDSYERVFYLKSFSKVMFPGQRIAISVVPSKYTNKFSNLKKIIDIQTSTLSQLTMNSFIESGMYDYYIRRIVNAYKEKAVKLQRALKKHMYSDQFNSNNNMHTIVKLPSNTNMTRLYKRFDEEKIIVDDYRYNYLKDSFFKPKFIKLNVMNVEEDRIDKGVLKIKQCIDSCIE